MRYVSAVEFEAKCLEFFDELEAGGEPITVIKDGEPLVVVEPVKNASSPGQPD